MRGLVKIARFLSTNFAGSILYRSPAFQKRSLFHLLRAVSSAFFAKAMVSTRGRWSNTRVKEDERLDLEQFTRVASETEIENQQR